MRKFIVGLMVASLLAFAGQVVAQDNGTGDPLGLISSAAVQPFWSAGANFTIFEITSPQWFNSFPGETLHAIFFNEVCDRDQSVPLPVTRNGLLLFTPDDIGIAYNGLAAIARTFNQVTLTPIPPDAPIHVRGHWVSLATDSVRVVDPISVAAAESNPLQTWNPLRSGNSWTNPLEGATFQTVVYLVCPSTAVLNALPVAAGFPPAPAIAFGSTAATSGILGVIYNDDEDPLRNITVRCVCITPLPVLSINLVYGDPLATDSDFFTELFTYPFPPAPPASPRTFTGYRGITVTSPAWPGGSGDHFGRLNNASAAALQGLVIPGLR